VRREFDKLLPAIATALTSAAGRTNIKKRDVVAGGGRKPE